jgi:hypothetical protein
MKLNLKNMLPAFALAFFLSIKIAAAQTITAQPLSFNVGLDAGQPLGQLHSTSTFVVGITPGLQYVLSNTFRLTLTTGVYNYFPKTILYEYENANLVAVIGKYKLPNEDIVPVKPGFKYLFAGNWYYSLEAGIAFASNSGGGTAFDGSTGFGYQFKRLDLGARIEGLVNYKGGVTLFARAAYSFN